MDRVRAWYRRRSRRQQGWLRASLPIAGTLLLVQIDWFFRHTQGVATQEMAQALFFRVGLTLAAAMLLKAALTRSWTLQDLGIALTLFGIAGLFVRLLARRGPQPTPEWERDYIHAMLDVGVVMLAVGVVLHVISRGRRIWRRRHYGQSRYDRRKGERRQSQPTSTGGPFDD